MLTPEYLDVAPNQMFELYANLETTIINDVARRIKKMDYLTATAEFQLQVAQEMGGIYENTILEIAKTNNVSEKYIKKTLTDAGVKSIEFDDNIYKTQGLEPVPITQSPAMLQILKANIKKTNGEITNLTGTTANYSQKAFYDSVNQAHLEITSGAFDSKTSIKNACKRVGSDGMRIFYPSGHSDHLDVAVRRATLTSISQTASKLQDERFEEMEGDLVETSAHNGARKEHQVWQGLPFSRRGNKKYPDFVSSTNYGEGKGLAGWNCAHSWFPFFEGLPKQYTKQQLKEINEKKVTYNNKQIDYTEAREKQRYNERQIRKWKREVEATKGLENSFEKSKVKEYQAKQRDLIKQTGLRRDSSREQIIL